MTYYLRANVKFFKMLHANYGTNDYNIKHPVQNDVFSVLYLLFDTIHLLKNVKNNWLTEKMKRLHYYDSLTDEDMFAEFKDIIAIFVRERDLIVRQTKLTFSTVYPTNFDKQKVDLMLNVFNEKAAAVLEAEGRHGTAIFVKHVSRLFHMLNVKSLYAGQAGNDPDREPFTTPLDSRFEFINRMAKSFQKMAPSSTPYPTRVMCLTEDTSQALSLTLNGIIALTRRLLTIKGIDYVLTGIFQSDRIEAEFGIYRQLNGGNYYMSSEQIKSSLKLQRIRLFSKLDMLQVVIHNGRNCCSEPLSESEIELLDSCFYDVNKLTAVEKSSIDYISGFIAYKENIYSDESDQVVNGCPYSEFTEMVSRGSLRHPPLELFDLGLFMFN